MSTGHALLWKPGRAACAALLSLAAAAGLPLAAAGSAAGQQLTPRAASGQAAARVTAASIPQPGHHARQLLGVRCASRRDCWAVGWFAGSHSTRSQALHWNGSAWARVATPDPGTLATVLQSVTCTSHANCWAVGSATDGTSNDQTPVLTVAMHWNGHLWSVVPTPNPAGATSGDVNGLQSVACVSAADCWAVGSSGGSASGSPSHNVALHWNGRRWSAVPAPDRLAGNGLFSVRCTRSSDCWAVGDTGGFLHPCCFSEFDVALRWNGRTWTPAPTPKPGKGIRALLGVSCTSSTNCWAVGAAGGINDSPILNQALHWNGRAWALVHTPNPSGTRRNDQNILQAVACPAARNCWAVGFHDTGFATSQPVRNEALHWNGSSWTRILTPQPGGTVQFANNHLYAVTCTSTANCWAVGYFSRSAEVPHHDRMNQILHWDGSRWTLA